MGKSCSTFSTRCRRDRRTTSHGRSTRINSTVQGAKYAIGMRRSPTPGGRRAMFLDNSSVKPEPRMANAVASPRPIARSIAATNAAGATGWR